MAPDILFYLIIGISLLCWGSFLNVLSFRLIRGTNLIPRSSCPHCKKLIPWYDLFPVASYLILKGKCRNCQALISPLYLFIEILSCIILGLNLALIPSPYMLGYFIFFSALIVSIRSDLETMLLSRWMTLYAVPVGWLLAYSGWIPLTLQESMLGAFFGYGFLWFVRTVFYLLTKKEGLGEGDLDMTAFIGAFVGTAGVWNVIVIGSSLGTIVSLIYLLASRREYNTPLPFGPFLALGAIVQVFLQQSGISLL